MKQSYTKTLCFAMHLIVHGSIYGRAEAWPVIVWNRTPCSITQSLMEKISAYVEDHTFEFQIKIKIYERPLIVRSRLISLWEDRIRVGWVDTNRVLSVVESLLQTKRSPPLCYKTKLMSSVLFLILRSSSLEVSINRECGSVKIGLRILIPPAFQPDQTDFKCR